MFSAFQSNAFQNNAFQIVVADEAVHDSFAFDTRKRHKKSSKQTAKTIKVDDTALNEVADTIINKMFGKPEKVKVKKQKAIQLLNDNIEQTNIINLALARKQKNRDLSLILLLC